MSTALEQLHALFDRLAALDHAATFLNWDQMVMMPERGVTRRADSLAEIAGIRHELLTDKRVIDLVGEAEANAADAETLASLREMRQLWEREACLPAELVKAQIRAGSNCELGWRTQKPANDWAGFLVNFKPVLELAREESRIRLEAGNGRFATPYESLLDLYCTGDSAALLTEVFADLRAAIPGLMQRVMEQQGPRGKALYSGPFAVATQQELSHELMKSFGFDFNAGRLDVSAHPFSTGDGADQRITTRYIDDGITDALLATAHETGHASYEAHLPEKWAALPVGLARNMCIHESQSLLFEKQLFLSRAFFTHFSSEMTRFFPGQINGSVDELWQELVVVKPGYIRVDADEVTYPMHVLLRYEIEEALINGDMEAADIPDAWQEKMQSYLGLSVDGDHKNGCLQDIHWTDGGFGYFPSYTMGAVNAAQIFATIKNQFSDWQQQLSGGDTRFVREWLDHNIWQRASFLSSQDLMIEATGSASSASFLLEHLEARYLNASY
ncbi:MAG: carboxypeptidase M32 [Gammaproteobacteria bacterium]|nr:carboxypeptidase M32 [Gammaproteobacteria bacterium]